MESTLDLIIILFLSANPANTAQLELVNECNKISDELQYAAGKKIFKLEQRHDISLHDLRKQILNYNPQMVHFSGHGSQRSALIFKSDKGDVEVVPSDALSEFFERVSKDISLVFLNACYSEDQAKAISQHVDFVIGMSRTISDEASIAFATSFYSSLGFGLSIDDAFNLAIGDLKLFSIPEDGTPQSISQGGCRSNKELIFESKIFDREIAYLKEKYLGSKSKFAKDASSLLGKITSNELIQSSSELSQTSNDQSQIDLLIYNMKKNMLKFLTMLSPKKIFGIV